MDQHLPFSNLNPQQLKLVQVFFPYAYARTLEVINRGTRFVHYTTAEAAMRMTTSREVWLRKSSCMNDYMEVEHGFECLNSAYKKHRQHFSAMFDSVFPSFCNVLEKRFNDWLPHFRSDSFIACLSEHEDNEDVTGRLSMWRAYGSNTGVAIVLHSAPFITPSDVLKAYTSPVAYLDAVQFDQEFSRLLTSIEENLEMIRTLDQQAILGYVFEAFRSSILCTKHPGFREEKEWRIIYSPKYRNSDRLISDIQIINGAPQPIYKVPLVDVPTEGLVGIEIPKLVNRVIIGPTRHPLAIREAFVTLLQKEGMADADKRVVVSDIPLRL